MRRSFIAAPLALALALLAAPAAQADIINLDYSAPVDHDVSLSAGTWRITPLEADHTAWSAWAETIDCDADGTNCTQGWRWGHELVDSADAIISIYTSSTWWETAQDALDEAMADGPFTFTLAGAQDLSFIFSDSDFSDNRGGISFDLSRIDGPPTPVSEPGTLALLAGALLLLAGRRRAGG